MFVTITDYRRAIPHARRIATFRQYRKPYLQMSLRPVLREADIDAHRKRQPDCLKSQINQRYARIPVYRDAIRGINKTSPAPEISQPAGRYRLVCG